MISALILDIYIYIYIYIDLKIVIFLCLARKLPLENEDAEEQPIKPSKRQKIENMATACYPGQLCVIFDICF